MAIVVAEYLGIRTDSDALIKPYPYTEVKGKGIQFDEKGICPFNKLPCKKMDKKKNARFPVCSLRRNDELYIVCEHRLVSTSRNKGLPLSPYQNGMLLSLAKEIFNPTITAEQLFYKAEVRMSSGSRADYIIRVRSDVEKTYGPRKLIVEMQGGGETSQTGSMTDLLGQWSDSPNPTNTQLASSLNVGLIQTNAWRRLQEQILTKGSVAEATKYGLVACIGTHVFDLVKKKLNNFNGLQISKENSDWNIALIAYGEDRLGARLENTIPLKIDESRIIYTTYKELAKRLIERGEPDPKPFSEQWNSLTGEMFGDDDNPIKKQTAKKKGNKTSPNNEGYYIRPFLDVTDEDSENTSEEDSEDE